MNIFHQIVIIGWILHHLIVEELEKILNTPITDKQINAIEKARDIILNKHNVWEIVSNIVTK